MRYVLLAVCVCYTLLMMTSCASVKPYQKSKLNDAEMVLSSRSIERYENNFLMYREGASGGNGGKTGGGCGCN
ncbi:MAG: hypothetical protein H6Q13_2506 [Bacteroidetes bacterium]|jgi:hypothetical protein|nr:hypothetical protein [Bacteroidota bacterium]